MAQVRECPGSDHWHASTRIGRCSIASGITSSGAAPTGNASTAARSSDGERGAKSGTSASVAACSRQTWWLKAENPQLWAGLRRAPEATASFQAAQAALRGQCGSERSAASVTSCKRPSYPDAIAAGGGGRAGAHTLFGCSA